MLKTSIFIAFSLLAYSAFSQETAVKKSIHIEYAYTGLEDQPEYMKSIYGAQRFEVFADDKYYMITSRQAIESQENTPAILHLVSTVVTEYTTQKSYLCIAFDTVRIKSAFNSHGEEGTNMQEILFGATGNQIQSSKSTEKAETIATHPCKETIMEYNNRTPLSLWYDPQVKPVGDLAKSPFFLTVDGKYYGLILGHNQQMGPMRLILRAKKMEIDGPSESLEKVLGSYRTVSREESDRIIGEIVRQK